MSCKKKRSPKSMSLFFDTTFIFSTAYFICSIINWILHKWYLTICHAIKILTISKKKNCTNSLRIEYVWKKVNGFKPIRVKQLKRALHFYRISSFVFISRIILFERLHIFVQSTQLISLASSTSGISMIFNNVHEYHYWISIKPFTHTVQTVQRQWTFFF